MTIWPRKRSRRVTLYYDDACGICRRLCAIVAAFDRAGNIRFVGRSVAAAAPHGFPAGLLDATVVAVDDVTGEVTIRSRAVARVLRALPLPWHALRIIALPGVRFLSDRIYDLVAAHRHRISSWVGLGRCGLPTPSDRKGGCERTEPR